tara:strand:+ start:254 stop:487 length:234 start_codon:yes stop_codon:yes gene_type:complete
MSESEEREFDTFMDAFEEKENEILQERINMYKEFEKIKTMEGNKEFLEIDMNRYKLHYFGWSIGSVVLLLLAAKIMK